MSDFEVKPATRASVKALVGFYGKSGGGKTMSALLFARGLVGPTGRIVVVDTENRRASLFADLIPGGYSVIDLGEPFGPDRYTLAIEAAEKAADCIVVDSMSHEWAGEGGVLDMQEAELDRMAGDNYSKREACKMAAWIKPKMAHKKFVQRLLRSPAHILCCLRGEEKTKMDKGADGRRTVQKDDFTTCIADSRFIFEMLINLECYDRDGTGGFVHIRKITRADTRACLPGPDEQIGIKHGEALARWCENKAPSPAATPAAAPAPVSDAAKLKRVLWDSTESIRGGAKGKEGMEKLTGWLRTHAIIAHDQSLEGLTVEQLKDVLEKTEVALCDVVP